MAVLRFGRLRAVSIRITSQRLTASHPPRSASIGHSLTQTLGQTDSAAPSPTARPQTSVTHQPSGFSRLSSAKLPARPSAITASTIADPSVGPSTAGPTRGARARQASPLIRLGIAPPRHDRGLRRALALIAFAALLPAGSGLLLVSASSAQLVVSGTPSPGATLTVSGSQFPVHDWIQLTWDGSPAGLPVVRTSTSASFTTTMTVPLSASAGSHILSAVDTSRGNGSNSQSSSPSTSTPLASVVVAISATSPTPTPSATASPSLTPSPSPSPTPTPTPTQTPSATPLVTPSPTPGLTFPALPSGYGPDVEAWWSTHPFNPESSSYIPIGGLADVTPVLNVQTQYGGNIQAALDALPQSGGTLYFPAGFYSGNFALIGRSNVHFVGATGAVITGGGTSSSGTDYTSPMFIAGCSMARDYTTFDANVVNGTGTTGATARYCASDGRIRDIYFRNLVFDGGGTATFSIRVAAANGVVFDGVTWQNFNDPGTSHMGLLVAHEVVDNIWVRGGHFVGNAQFALYADGCHFCGTVESTVDANFAQGALAYFNNNDYSFDYNGNHQLDGYTIEDRQAMYIVIANDVFGRSGTRSSMGDVAGVDGSFVVLRKNSLLRSANAFAHYHGECQIQGAGQFSSSVFGPNISYVFSQYRTVANSVSGSLFLFVNMDGARYNCFSANGQTSTMTIGHYQIRSNTVDAPGLASLVWEHGGLIDGPNCVVDNRLNGVAYANSGTC